MQFLRSEGLETPLLEHRIINAWPAVMGEGISKYTSELYIRNSILWVKLKSPKSRRAACRSSATNIKTRG